MGQTHGIEEHLAQLLGAVGVEAGTAGLHLDAGQHLRKFAAHPQAERLNAVPVHQDAGAGHVGQHLGQRELDVIVQRILVPRGDLGLHPGKKVGQRTGIGPGLTGECGLCLVACQQLGDLILRSRGVQQVGGQLAVPHDAAAPAAVGHGQRVERGGVEDVQRHGGVIQQADQRVVRQGIDGGVLHGIPGFRLKHDVFRALLAGHCRARGQQVMPGRRQGQDVYGALHGGQRLRVGCRGDAVQPEPGDEGVNLQLLQELHGSGLVALAHLVSALGGVDGRIGADGAQQMAQLGIGFAFQQVLPLLGLDDLVVDIGIHVFQCAELLHQREGGLFADAPHTGDIVGRVAHQALHLDELPGLDAVFFLNGGHIHGHSLAAAHGGGGQQDRGALAHQLQAVAVSRGQKAVVLAGITGCGQGAQDVVSFPALGRHFPVAQVGQQLLQHRHLLRQLFGHPMAGGFVAIVHLVAEGGGFEVERDGDLVRVALLEQGEQDIQKTINGVGIAAVLGGQQLDAEKGTVRDAVAVNDQ